MIELIFVIVILGILAAVAIPKLAATRDDAKISKLASNIKTGQAEVASYITATGNRVFDNEQNFSTASNVIEEGLTNGTITTTASTIANAAANAVMVQFVDTDNNNQVCINMDVNDTDIRVRHGGGASAICVGVQSLVPEANISIAGQGVRY